MLWMGRFFEKWKGTVFCWQKVICFQLCVCVCSPLKAGDPVISSAPIPQLLIEFYFLFPSHSVFLLAHSYHVEQATIKGTYPFHGGIISPKAKIQLLGPRAWAAPRSGWDEASIINVLQAGREKSPNTLVAFRKKKKRSRREKKALSFIQVARLFVICKMRRWKSTKGQRSPRLPQGFVPQTSAPRLPGCPQLWFLFL